MTWILHVDLDQFLAAVEKRRQPELRDAPVVVGGEGDPTKPRQVVACASYEARTYGVHAGMPLRTAHRKCPDAVFLPSDAPTYEAASEEVMDLMRRFPIQLEVWGWDEAFAGASSDEPEELARAIRAALADELSLTCCVGIGDNKLTAKMATGIAKRDRSVGIHTITRADWLPLFGAQPTDTVWGIGTRTAQKLETIGISTVALLAVADEQLLASTFGPTIGPWLRRMGNGVGDTTISTAPRLARGRSRSVTYPHDLTERAEIEARITELAHAVTAEVVAEDRVVERVAVTVRTSTFFTRTKSSKLPTPTTDADSVARAALFVLDRFELDRPVRLLGVRVDLQTPTARLAP